MGITTNYIDTYLFNSDLNRLNLQKTTELINNTNWHHYAITYDGTTAILYLDGQAIVSKPFSGSLAVQPTRSIVIAQVFGKSFGGIIDEVRLYNRALSQQEIQNIYTG